MPLGKQDGLDCHQHQHQHRHYHALSPDPSLQKWQRCSRRCRSIFHSCLFLQHPSRAIAHSAATCRPCCCRRPQRAFDNTSIMNVLSIITQVMHIP
jgi:hypothetical protein